MQSLQTASAELLTERYGAVCRGKNSCEKEREPFSESLVSTRSALFHQKNRNIQNKGVGLWTHLTLEISGLSVRMSMAETNLLVFLSPESEIPPDVLFRIPAEEEDTTREGSRKTIGAHRLILAAVSPVFRGMFFGPMKDTSEVIDVKETTAEAFETMIT